MCAPPTPPPPPPLQMLKIKAFEKMVWPQYTDFANNFTYLLSARARARAYVCV